MDINDVVIEYFLYDEHVECKEGYEIISLEKTDVDFGKQIQYWEIKIYDSANDVYLECEFGDSDMCGVRDGYTLRQYTPDKEDELEEDSSVHEFALNLKYAVEALMDEIKRCTYTSSKEESGRIQSVNIEDIENQMKKVETILNNK